MRVHARDCGVRVRVRVCVLGSENLVCIELCSIFSRLRCVSRGTFEMMTKDFRLYFCLSDPNVHWLLSCLFFLHSSQHPSHAHSAEKILAYDYFFSEKRISMKFENQPLFIGRAS